MNRFLLGVAVCLLALATWGWHASAIPDGTYANPIVSVQPDTLYHTVRAGDVFIFTLPDTLNALPVEGYAIVRAPALSWLAGRSFFWRTQSDDDGLHRLLFEAAFDDTPPDTLSVEVSVLER